MMQYINTQNVLSLDVLEFLFSPGTILANPFCLL